MPVQGQAQLPAQLPAQLHLHLHQSPAPRLPALHPCPAQTPQSHPVQVRPHQLPPQLPQQVLPQWQIREAWLSGHSVGEPTSAPPIVQMLHGVTCNATVV